MYTVSKEVVAPPVVEKPKTPKELDWAKPTTDPLGLDTGKRTKMTAKRRTK